MTEYGRPVYSCVVLVDDKGYMGGKKGLIRIAGRPMIEFVLDAVPDQVTEIVISVEGEAHANSYQGIAERYMASLIVGKTVGLNEASKIRSAFESVTGSNVLLLPCEMPCLTLDFTYFLLDASRKFTAVLPRMMDGSINHRLASYQTDPLLNALRTSQGSEMSEVVRNLGNVLYLSTNALRFFDSKLTFLYKVTSASDIPRVENIIRNRR